MGAYKVRLNLGAAGDQNVKAALDAQLDVLVNAWGAWLCVGSYIDCTAIQHIYNLLCSNAPDSARRLNIIASLAVYGGAVEAEAE